MGAAVNPAHRKLNSVGSSDGRFNILNNSSPRPFFGSPDVAAYGAVGLDLDLPDPRDGTDGRFESVPRSKGPRETFQLDPTNRVPLIGSLSHHNVDGMHLWIAVEAGKLVVADEIDHLLLLSLIAEKSPLYASDEIQRGFGLDRQTAWHRTNAFLGRLAAAGFIEGITGYHSAKKIRPYEFARLHLTHRCQLECIHCYTNSSPHLSREGELPVERWVRVVDEFAEQGGKKILFTGGEALVYPGCIEIMRRAHALGLEVTLFSNGILIPKHIAEIKESADFVQISVDGPTAETHDLVRGPGSFSKAMRAIRLLLDAGIQTRMSTTIMMNNWGAIKEGLPGFLEQFKGTNLAFKISYGVMAHGRGEALDSSLNTNEVRQFVDSLLNKVSQTDNRDDAANVVQRVSGCGYAEQLVIAPDGIVYPCHLMSGPLGHIDDMPIRDITRYLVRTAQAFSVDNRLGCATCDLRHLCGGTCRVDDEKHTGSRLVTTCTPEDKLRKKRFLVRRYRPVER